MPPGPSLASNAIASSHHSQTAYEEDDMTLSECDTVGNHMKTLQKLYAWERKLYDEVKVICLVYSPSTIECEAMHIHPINGYGYTHRHEKCCYIYARLMSIYNRNQVTWPPLWVPWFICPIDLFFLCDHLNIYVCIFSLFFFEWETSSFVVRTLFFVILASIGMF